MKAAIVITICLFVACVGYACVLGGNDYRGDKD